MKNVLNYVHDPTAVLDYGYDFGPELAAGETISSVTAIASAPSATLTGTGKIGPENVKVTTTAESTVSTWITFHVVTTAGREDTRTIRLLVAGR